MHVIHKYSHKISLLTFFFEMTHLCFNRYIFIADKLSVRIVNSLMVSLLSVIQLKIASLIYEKLMEKIRSTLESSLLKKKHIKTFHLD